MCFIWHCAQKELRKKLASLAIAQLQTVVYFSAVYRPHNAYCLIIDSKSPDEFFALVQKVSNCYNEYYKTDNIFIYDKPLAVCKYNHHQEYAKGNFTDN